MVRNVVYNILGVPSKKCKRCKEYTMVDKNGFCEDCALDIESKEFLKNHRG